MCDTKEKTQCVLKSLPKQKYISLKCEFVESLGLQASFFQLHIMVLHSLNSMYRKDKVIIPLTSGDLTKCVLF